jgi:hypothetical protein
MLQSLELVGVKLNGDGLKHLASLTRLRRLDLRRSGVSNLSAIDALTAANPALQVVQYRQKVVNTRPTSGSLNAGTETPSS